MLSGTLDRAALCQLIPHAGSMVLLDAVLRWDADGILCRAVSHHDSGNPLRRAGMLPGVCGIEFAAQAMALHGALLAGEAQRAGFLSSLRGVRVLAARLDDATGPLEVSATVLANETRGCIYDFAVADGARTLVSGQAAVILS